MTPAQEQALAHKRSAEAQAAQKRENAGHNGGKTGAPPGMLQDDSRGLSRYLANSPHARQHVKEACAAIKAGKDTL